MAGLRRRACRTLAVSTVIGTVLMTTLTITLGSVVVFWASQTFGVYQGNAGVYFNNRGTALREAFAIEDVWFYNSASSSCYPQGSTTYSCLNVTIRNTGVIQLSIVAFYINSTAQTPLSPTLPYTLPVSSVKTFTIKYATSWGSTTKAYFFQIATSRGNQVSAFFGYP